jgi:L-amino acid N-acyltransferase YncA
MMSGTQKESVLELRDARPDDAEAIATIYNHYVLNSTISFEEEPVSGAVIRQRIADVQDAGLPWLVALVDGRVAAYAYATKWRVRAAYRYSVESSVYVSVDMARRGLGLALYTALLERLRNAGIHLVIGGIALSNDSSLALHEKLGYKKAAHFSEVGLKFGRWIDVGYWQLKISAQPGTEASL